VQDDDDLIRECLKAGARSYLLKSEMEGQLRRAIKSLAAHEPFFTGRVSQALLDSFLDAPTQSGTRLKTSESNVLQLLAGGHTNEEIARRLNLSLKLVETLVRVASHSDLLHSIE
jgi:DNA-binding NarL/FixJ family response regulator